MIVVTHNFEDLKEYATRHIRIYDGEIESDECIVGEKPRLSQKTGQNDFSIEREFIFRKKRKKNIDKLKKTGI